MTPQETERGPRRDRVSAERPDATPVQAGAGATCIRPERTTAISGFRLTRNGSNLAAFAVTTGTSTITGVRLVRRLDDSLVVGWPRKRLDPGTGRWRPLDIPADLDATVLALAATAYHAATAASPKGASDATA